MKRGAKIYYGELYCPVCGTRMVIPRRGLRKQGHIKTMFCGRCGEIRDFVEEVRAMSGERIVKIPEIKTMTLEEWKEKTDAD